MSGNEYQRLQKWPWGAYAGTLVGALMTVGTLIASLREAPEHSWQVLTGAACAVVMFSTLTLISLAVAVHGHPTRVYSVNPKWIPRSRWAVNINLLLLPSAVATAPGIGLLGAEIYPELSPWHRFLMIVGVLVGVATPFLLLWYARKALRSGAHLSLLDDGLRVHTPVGKHYFITKAQLSQSHITVRGGLQVVIHPPPDGSRAVTIALMNYGPTPASALRVLVPYLVDNGAHVRSTWL
ncbi:hypothetical protein [Gordonia paraffinivorans]|uniref:Uncharacterized protein n=1 Tax=Gordonia paraffinivorans NBRC 108238 TaxID=1223543 RepID=A0ABQ0IMR4_9ACTN|nr:hypothetical protein [Gordonia paraffinivorans]GAC84854.1 hypothetical protein GP2_026_00910 [Gordonia paraffinivorans NBRC 108238]